MCALIKVCAGFLCCVFVHLMCETAAELNSNIVEYISPGTGLDWLANRHVPVPWWIQPRDLYGFRAHDARWHETQIISPLRRRSSIKRVCKKYQPEDGKQKSRAAAEDIMGGYYGNSPSRPFGNNGEYALTTTTINMHFATLKRKPALHVYF